MKIELTDNLGIAKLWEDHKDKPLINAPNKESAKAKRSKAIGNLCPCCKQRMTRSLSGEGKRRDSDATLDHLLPKTYFPQFMFFYDNLQIICRKCNEDKGENLPTYPDPMELYEYLQDQLEEIQKGKKNPNPNAQNIKVNLNPELPKPKSRPRLRGESK